MSTLFLPSLKLQTIIFIRDYSNKGHEVPQLPPLPVHFLGNHFQLPICFKGTLHLKSEHAVYQALFARVPALVNRNLQPLGNNSATFLLGGCLCCIRDIIKITVVISISNLKISCPRYLKVIRVVVYAWGGIDIGIHWLCWAHEDWWSWACLSPQTPVSSKGVWPFLLQLVCFRPPRLEQIRWWLVIIEPMLRLNERWIRDAQPWLLWTAYEIFHNRMLAALHSGNTLADWIIILDVHSFEKLTLIQVRSCSVRSWEKCRNLVHIIKGVGLVWLCAGKPRLHSQRQQQIGRLG